MSCYGGKDVRSELKREAAIGTVALADGRTQVDQIREQIRMKDLNAYLKCDEGEHVRFLQPTIRLYG